MIKYSPLKIGTMNTAKTQIFINKPSQGSIIFLLTSYLDLNFDVLKAFSGNRFADGNDNRLYNLGPIAFFSTYKLTTSSGNHLEDIIYVEIVSFKYKLLTNAKESDDFVHWFWLSSK